MRKNYKSVQLIFGFYNFMNPEFRAAVQFSNLNILFTPFICLYSDLLEHISAQFLQKMQKFGSV